MLSLLFAIRFVLGSNWGQNMKKITQIKKVPRKRTCLRGFLAKNAYFDTMHPLDGQGVHFCWGKSYRF
jgi:hypothetical protein